MGTPEPYAQKPVDQGMQKGSNNNNRMLNLTGWIYGLK